MTPSTLAHAADQERNVGTHPSVAPSHRTLLSLQFLQAIILLFRFGFAASNPLSSLPDVSLSLTGTNSADPDDDATDVGAGGTLIVDTNTGC